MVKEGRGEMGTTEATGDGAGLWEGHDQGKAATCHVDPTMFTGAVSHSQAEHGVREQGMGRHRQQGSTCPSPHPRKAATKSDKPIVASSPDFYKRSQKAGFFCKISPFKNAGSEFRCFQTFLGHKPCLCYGFDPGVSRWESTLGASICPAFSKR